MPDIVPNTQVKVLRDVPLDSTYTDTRWFESISSQTAYFSGKAKYTYTNFSYQRVNSSVANPRVANSVRVPEVADNLYDCNYIMFQNSNYGSKWFYAFIKKINYISPENTEIIYEIDHIQTYMTNFTILPCLVEREHSSADLLYGNLQPEPFQEFDMFTDSVTEMPMQDGLYINILTNAGSAGGGTTAGSDIVGGVYNSCNIAQFTNPEGAKNYLEAYDADGRASSIVAVFMSPYDDQGKPLEYYTITRPTQLNSYTPKNRKLFTYPYCKMTLSNRQGQEYDFYYEYFTSMSAGQNPIPVDIQFNTVGYGGSNPKAFCVAVNYNGVQGSINMDYNKVCEISNFPQCAWTSNAYLNWLNGEFEAQSNAANASALIQGGVGAVLTFVPGMQPVGAGLIASAAIQAGVNAASNITQMYQRAKTPGLTKGSPHSPQLNLAGGNVGFTLKQMAIPPEYAQMVDSYFDMYGYSTNQVKTPNLTGRENWNYVKTNNCIIKGSMPVDSMNAIKQMFNNGIRLWHTDFVGDYSLSNRCLSEVNNDVQ